MAESLFSLRYSIIQIISIHYACMGASINHLAILSRSRNQFWNENFARKQNYSSKYKYFGFSYYCKPITKLLYNIECRKITKIEILP